MIEDIKHNLEVAKPPFLFFIKNMNPELSKWIQYKGIEANERGIFFKFKSSQNSLSFEVYGGVNMPTIEDKLNCQTNYIYEYFRKLKYDNIVC